MIEYEVGPEKIIIQLGMLILKGRIPQDVQSNENRSIRGDISVHYDKVLIHAVFLLYYFTVTIIIFMILISSLYVCVTYQGDFLMLWKSCEVMYIEVWLHRDEQFHEEDAMDGHNGYLLIEQWHIEIKQSR